MLLVVQTNGTSHADESDIEYYAVIVGVGNYPGRINDLTYPVDDAKGIYNRIRYIWGEDHIKLLCDSQATKESIEEALSSWLGERADVNDVVLFCYSGHGAPDHLIPYYSLQWPYPILSTTCNLVFSG